MLLVLIEHWTCHIRGPLWKSMKFQGKRATSWKRATCFIDNWLLVVLTTNHYGTWPSVQNTCYYITKHNGGQIIFPTALYHPSTNGRTICTNVEGRITTVMLNAISPSKQAQHDVFCWSTSKINKYLTIGRHLDHIRDRTTYVIRHIARFRFPSLNLTPPD